VTKRRLNKYLQTSFLRDQRDYLVMVFSRNAFMNSTLCGIRKVPTFNSTSRGSFIDGRWLRLKEMMALKNWNDPMRYGVEDDK